MVLFFIADLALSIAFKLSTWCLGKTCDGIMYIMTRHKCNNNNNNLKGTGTNNNDDEFIVISRQEYRVLKKFHGLHHVSASEEESEEASEEASEEVLASASTSK